ncbi:MAG TPA: hypothetical protein PKA37_02570 [Planctomycetota bacterium]|jgi:hypothetical protein|nr:hypothetical protein [Planctomycetota bacterium]
MLTPIPAGLLQLPIEGRNLDGSTLRSELATNVRLLVFLRHFG